MSTTAAVLRFIAEYKTEHGGQSPTLREIGVGVGIASTSQTSVQLDILESEGRIERGDSRVARSIALPGERYVSPQNTSS